MPKKFLFFLLIYIFQSLITYGQLEVQKIVPLTPNAAELSKYIEMPVGSFTGIPAIGLPIYEIKSKELSLPLNLNYHSGGNKVETIPSWVGLGWSISGMPIISRSVRGLADEGPAGYFDEYLGKKVMELYNNQNGTTQQQTDWKNYLRAVREGNADPEPDLFAYSIEGKSGKFFYDQETEEFMTFPKENMIIEAFHSNATVVHFRITMSTGNVYIFNNIEYNESWRVSDINNVSRVTTSWNVSKIYNSNKTDSLSFNYDTEVHFFSTINSASRYILYNEIGCVYNPPQAYEYELAHQLAQNMALMPSSITFSNGSVKFIRKSVQREDLTGGYALDSIKVFTNDGIVVKQFGFQQEYLIPNAQGYGCATNDPTDKKWLILTSFKEYGDNKESVYGFEYDRTKTPPCRTSPAQDFWGFYNGKVSNQDLVPTSRIDVPGQIEARKIQGANRFVDTSYTQFGILKKVIYPTKGYTDYTYENNNASDTILPHYYTNKSAALEGEETITTNYYSSTFVINNPKDLYLNNLHHKKGAFVTITSAGFGCDLTNGSNTCATIRIKGISAENASIDFPIWGNISNNSYSSFVHLPNGTYKIEATFNQAPPQYNGFFVHAVWQTLDSSKNLANRQAGGLRIKKN